MSLFDTGSVIGDRYRVVKRLGAGGFGEVYLVEHLHLASGKKFALKVLRTTLGGAEDEKQRLRFEREVNLALELVHPNIVTIRDFTRIGNTPCYAMDYVDGVTLQEVLRRGGPLEPARVVRLAREVLGALPAAHRQGFVHRDLKPGNIFLLADGRVKVLDFGIAAIVHGGSEVRRLTQPGIGIGTAAYVSPEQARGEELDGRSDVYALGVILFEALTGRLPFAHDDAREMIAAHLWDRPPRLGDVRTDLAFGEALEEVVAGALVKDRADRFPDVPALAAALEAAVRPAAPISLSPGERVGVRAPVLDAAPAPPSQPVTPPSRPPSPPSRQHETPSQQPQAPSQQHQPPSRQHQAPSQQHQAPPRPPSRLLHPPGPQTPPPPPPPPPAPAPPAVPAQVFRGRARIDLPPGASPSGVRTVFVIGAPVLRLGRAKPGQQGPGAPDNTLVLRVLPCRSAALDPANFAATREISGNHATIEEREGAAWLTDHSSLGTTLDDIAVPKGTPVRLPSRFRLRLAQALTLEGRTFPADPARDRPLEAVHFRRVGSCPEHAYLWVVRAASLGAAGEPVVDGGGEAGSVERSGDELRFRVRGLRVAACQVGDETVAPAAGPHEGADEP